MRPGSVRCPLDHRPSEQRFRANSKRPVPSSCSGNSKRPVPSSCSGTRRDLSPHPAPHPPKRPVSLPTPAPRPSIPPRALPTCDSSSPRGPSFRLPPATRLQPLRSSPEASSPEACLFVHLHTPRRVPSVFPQSPALFLCPVPSPPSRRGPSSYPLLLFHPTTSPHPPKSRRGPSHHPAPPPPKRPVSLPTPAPRAKCPPQEPCPLVTRATPEVRPSVSPRPPTPTTSQFTRGLSLCAPPHPTKSSLGVPPRALPFSSALFPRPRAAEVRPPIPSSYSPNHHPTTASPNTRSPNRF
jgi:hypothetical protein